MKTYLLLFAIMTSMICDAASYEVFKDGNNVILQEKFSNKILKSGTNETEILEYCLDLMAKEDGGRLDIGAGEFFISGSLKIGNNITIAGQGKFTKLIFTGQHSMAEGIQIKDAVDVEIRDVMVISRDQQVRSGIVVDNSGSCYLLNSKVIGFGEYGVVFKNNTFLSKVEGCELGGNLISNIYFEELAKKGRYGDFLPNTISNNTIVGGGKGIETKRAIVANIIGCSIYQTTDIGIHLHSVSNSVLISGCRTFQITGHAVLVEDTDELNVSSNIFCWHTGSGIVVRNAAWGTISANEFIDNGSYNPNVPNNTVTYEEVPESYTFKDGIVLANVSGFTVGNNAIFNWGVCPKMSNGIFEDELSYNNIISGNNINYFENKAIDSNGTNSIVKDNISRASIPYTQLKNETDKNIDKISNIKIIQSFDKSMILEYLEHH